MVDEDEVPRGALAPPPRKSTLLRVDDAETDIPSVAGSQPISISTHPLHATLQTRYIQRFDRTWKKPRASFVESNTSSWEDGHALDAPSYDEESPRNIVRGETSTQDEQDLDKGPPPTTTRKPSWHGYPQGLKTEIQAQTSMVKGTTTRTPMDSNILMAHKHTSAAESTLQQEIYEATGSGQQDKSLWQSAYQSAQSKLQSELNIRISLDRYIQTMCAPGRELLRRELVRKTLSILKYKKAKVKLKLKRQSN